MSVDQNWNGLVEEALQALVSMEPERIACIDVRLRECGAALGVARSGRMTREQLTTLRLARAAAIQAAHLWGGCVPQPGYSPGGPMIDGAVQGSLSVTG
jgi:hypothetical protein